MPSPPPDPSGHSSARRPPTPPASGSSVRPTPDSAAPDAAAPPRHDEDTPTVISANRPRLPSGPEMQLAESLAGRRLGHFELIDPIGVGGMAAVIKAHDLDLGRMVALKILPPDMAADPENITRFKQEARAAAKLDHENIARVYFCGEDQGLHFIAFEFVEGDNLRTLTVKRGGILPVGEAVRYMVQVAAGLAHAAARAVVHRDIKPSNILITPEGKAKIVDMGLARNLDPHPHQGALTASGVTLGTFDYISPEQAIEPRSADVRSDIYSLGCTFYHLLTGQPPVPEGTAAKKLHSHQHVAPLDPREMNPAIPNELAAILGRMMAKTPERRYQHPDQLIGHLLALAEKLQIPIGPLAHNSATAPAYVEPALPAPPRLSPLWVGVAVLALVIAVVAVTGGLGSRNPIDQHPFWEGKQAPAITPSPEQAGGGPPNLTEAPIPPIVPQKAKDAGQLVEMLKQPAARITLEAGQTYDLTKPLAGADPPEALFEGRELTLSGDAANPPTIRIRYSVPDNARSSRPGSLTLRGRADGSGRPVRVALNNIRFEVVAADVDGEEAAGMASDPTAGLCVSGMDKFEVNQCRFLPRKGAAQAQGAGPAVVQIVHHADPGNEQQPQPQAHFQRCYFAPGGVAVRAVGVQVSAADCALAPQAAAFQALGDPDDPTPTRIQLDHCTALLDGGVVVEVGDRVGCQVSAGHCLFSGPEAPESSEPECALVRQLGTRAKETRYAGTDGTFFQSQPNGYYNVAIYVGKGEKGLTFAECAAKNIPAADPGERTLNNPWPTPHPTEELETEPAARTAFVVKPSQRQLRLPAGADKRVPNVLGVRYWLNETLYTLPLPSHFEDEPRLAANQRVWQPEAPSGPLPAGVYRDLRQALAGTQRGDELVLRFNGVQEIAPVAFTESVKLTVKADTGYRPVLGLKSKAVQAFLFKLSDGTLTFEGVQFRLRPDRGRAIVALPGGGECSFRDCVLTLEEGRRGDVEVPLSAVTLIDPRNEMMMPGGTTVERVPAPKVAFENCFVRGKGRLVSVQGSRPFGLDLTRVLVVLDGTLLDIEPSAADVMGMAAAEVKLHQLTAYLTGQLLHLQANPKQLDTKGVGLVPAHVQASNCLFAPASLGAPLVRLDRVENEKQMAELFVWEGARNNLYGYPKSQELLKIQPESLEAMPLKTFDADAWLAQWRESPRSFNAVRFKVKVGENFTGVQPGDFDLLSKDLLPQPPPEEGYGAPVEALPAPTTVEN
jgi:Protein kinase domain